MTTVSILNIFVLLNVGCDGGDVPIPDTVSFKENLSEYEIYDGNMNDIIPNENFFLYELHSPLFSNYSKKQRLIQLPDGEQIRKVDNGMPLFPEGTIIVKTFYYDLDERDAELGKQIIETRLLIKKEGLWNVGTYVWNEEQTEATLTLDGFDRDVTWIDENGDIQEIQYEYPDQRDCVSCHQRNEEVTPLGPTLRNLNIDINREEESVNQLEYFQLNEHLDDFEITTVSKIPDYKNENNSVEEKARAYFDMNCSHCHRPGAWKKATERDFDFQYETSLRESNILDKKTKILEVFRDGEMPYLGVTVVDDEGLQIIEAYLESL